MIIVVLPPCNPGSPVMMGPHKIPSWDFRIEEARQMWIDGVNCRALHHPAKAFTELQEPWAQ